MSPFRDGFGEEWVDTDDEEESRIKEKGEALLVEAEEDRNGGHKTRENIMEKGECMPTSIKLSQVCMEGGFESKEENSLYFQSKQEKLLVEMEFEISESCDILQMKGKHYLKNSNEHYLELEMQEKTPSIEPCIGWASAEGKRVPMIKRVMSEASFMQGPLMVSKREITQSTMNKREYNKAKEGAINNDWSNEAANMRDYMEKDEEMVEWVLNKHGSKEIRENMKKDGSEELVGAHQAPSMVCAIPLDALHTCPSTSKAVCKHQTVSKAVCTPSKFPKDSNKHPLSKGFQSLEEIQLNSGVLEAAQVHLEAISASLETHTHMKTKGVGNGRMKSLKEAHMPVEKLKSAQMHTKMRRAAVTASCQMKDSEGAHTEPNESKAHTNVKKEGIRRLKTLEVIHMGKKSPLREQGEGVGKQAIGGQLEVKEVECECCGMREECSIGYIGGVKAVFSGHWVCGLCAEAVHEERHRLGKGVPMEEAVRTHMNLCKQFSSQKRVGESPDSIGVAHAVCHLLSRHLSSPTSPTSPTSTRSTIPARPLLTRTSSCLPLFSHNPSCTT